MRGGVFLKGSISLLLLRPGQRGRVMDLCFDDDKRLRKSMSFGILPGALIRVLQIFPVFVLEIEHTELAIDSSIAQGIMVEKI